MNEGINHMFSIVNLHTSHFIDTSVTAPPRSEPALINVKKVSISPLVLTSGNIEKDEPSIPDSYHNATNNTLRQKIYGGLLSCTKLFIKEDIKPQGPLGLLTQAISSAGAAEDIIWHGKTVKEAVSNRGITAPHLVRKLNQCPQKKQDTILSLIKEGTSCQDIMQLMKIKPDTGWSQVLAESCVSNEQSLHRRLSATFTNGCDGLKISDPFLTQQLTEAPKRCLSTALEEIVVALGGVSPGSKAHEMATRILLAIERLIQGSDKDLFKNELDISSMSSPIQIDECIYDILRGMEPEQTQEKYKIKLNSELIQYLQNQSKRFQLNNLNVTLPTIVLYQMQQGASCHEIAHRYGVKENEPGWERIQRGLITIDAKNWFKKGKTCQEYATTHGIAEDSAPMNHLHEMAVRHLGKSHVAMGGSVKAFAALHGIKKDGEVYKMLSAHKKSRPPMIKIRVYIMNSLRTLFRSQAN